MITETAVKCQRKKRDASYYREYRRRKKFGAGNILPFPIQEQPKPKINSDSKLNYKTVIGFFFVILLTGILIHLSAPFYMQGHSKPMAYLMAALIELSLLFLLTMQTSGHFEKFAKYFLIASLSLYVLVPIALNPVKETQTKITEAQNQTESQSLKNKSIQSEIAIRKQKAELLQQRGRVTMAQLELQKIVELEEGLRNTITQGQTIISSEIEIRSSYAIAIQRLLLMLCNLFFVHHLIALLRLHGVATRQKPLSLRQLSVCAT